MILQHVLAGLGFAGGVSLRYNEDTQMVMFFLTINRHNPAATLTGSVVSVGTAPVRVHGKIADTRVRNPLHNRKDFDLTDPGSLEEIEEYLGLMMDKCDRRI